MRRRGGGVRRSVVEVVECGGVRRSEEEGRRSEEK